MADYDGTLHSRTKANPASKGSSDTTGNVAASDSSLASESRKSKVPTNGDDDVFSDSEGEENQDSKSSESKGAADFSYREHLQASDSTKANVGQTDQSNRRSTGQIRGQKIYVRVQIRWWTGSSAFAVGFRAPSFSDWCNEIYFTFSQVHRLEDGTIRVFSRNSEDMSKKYPDLVEQLPHVGFHCFHCVYLRMFLAHLYHTQCVKQGTTSFVFDSEAVAIDTKTGKLLPFQELSKRKRKDVKVSDIEVKVCLFAFDLLYLNGEVRASQRKLAF